MTNKEKINTYCDGWNKFFRKEIDFRNPDNSNELFQTNISSKRVYVYFNYMSHDVLDKFLSTEDGCKELWIHLKNILELEFETNIRGDKRRLLDISHLPPRTQFVPSYDINRFMLLSKYMLYVDYSNNVFELQLKEVEKSEGIND